jgi:hypothetical protein
MGGQYKDNPVPAAMSQALTQVMLQHRDILSISVKLQNGTEIFITNDGTMEYGRELDDVELMRIRHYLNKKYGLNIKQNLDRTNES